MYLSSQQQSLPVFDASLCRGPCYGQAKRSWVKINRARRACGMQVSILCIIPIFSYASPKKGAATGAYGACRAVLPTQSASRWWHRTAELLANKLENNDIQLQYTPKRPIGTTSMFFSAHVRNVAATGYKGVLLLVASRFAPCFNKLRHA